MASFGAQCVINVGALHHLYPKCVRAAISNWCNLRTGEDSTAYRRPNQEPAPQITVPCFRLCLPIHEAETLGQTLLEAVVEAKARVSQGLSRPPGKWARER
jgi:hypothetical protein